MSVVEDEERYLVFAGGNWDSMGDSGRQEAERASGGSGHWTGSELSWSWLSKIRRRFGGTAGALVRRAVVEG